MKEQSIWVDQFGGIAGHGMFVDSFIPEEAPGKKRHKSIKWLQPGTSYFDRRDLQLTSWKLHKPHAVYHLYSLGEAAWGAFHSGHKLNELDFQPELTGMIIVVERESILYALELISERGTDSLPTYGGIHFSWFAEQQLPYVIAASGYSESEPEEIEQLRTLLELTTPVPIIPGPPLYQHDPLKFDSEHANQVLIALHNLLNSHE